MAYGNDLADSPAVAYPLIARSTDAGNTWTTVFDDTDNNYLSLVDRMSSIDRDTIVAGLGVGFHKILYSSDRGVMWTVDTLLFGTTPDDLSGAKDAGVCAGIGLNTQGDLIGIFGPFDCCLLFGARVSLGVQAISAAEYGAQIYPNPATETVNITFSSVRLTIFDPLGRSYSVKRTGSTLDISSLPSGVYFISDGSSRAKFVKE